MIQVRALQIILMAPLLFQGFPETSEAGVRPSSLEEANFLNKMSAVGIDVDILIVSADDNSVELPTVDQIPPCRPFWQPPSLPSTEAPRDSEDDDVPPIDPQDPPQTACLCAGMSSQNSICRYRRDATPAQRICVGHGQEISYTYNWCEVSADRRSCQLVPKQSSYTSVCAMNREGSCSVELSGHTSSATSCLPRYCYELRPGVDPRQTPPTRDNIDVVVSVCIGQGWDQSRPPTPPAICQIQTYPGTPGDEGEDGLFVDTSACGAKCDSHCSITIYRKDNYCEPEPLPVQSCSPPDQDPRTIPAPGGPSYD